MKKLRYISDLCVHGDVNPTMRRCDILADVLTADSRSFQVLLTILNLCTDGTLTQNSVQSKFKEPYVNDTRISGRRCLRECLAAGSARGLALAGGVTGLAGGTRL